MKTCQLILLFACLISNMTVKAQQTISPNARTHNLMPVPASLQCAAGRLRLTSAFQVATKSFSDARLVSAVNRMSARLSGHTGITFTPGVRTDQSQATLVIDCAGPGRTIPSVDEDESYQLQVSDRQARLTAPTVVGALRGLETFLQ